LDTLFFSALFVTTLKVQWWLGFAAFLPIFFLHRNTRAISYCAGAVAASIYVSIVSINYFGFHGNTEFFAGAGLMATRTVRGPELVELGCARKMFSPEAAGFLCGEKYEKTPNSMGVKLSWARFAEELNSPEKFLQLSNVLRKLNFEWIFSHPSESLERLWWAFKTIWFDAYADPRGINPPTFFGMAFFAISVLLFLLLMPLEQSLALLCLFALSFVTVFLPNLSGPWEYRYLTPVRVFYHLVPALCAFLLLLRLGRRIQPAIRNFETR